MKKLIAVLALGATFPVMASGVYVGGQLGWAKTKFDGGEFSQSKNAFLGGVFAGYEFNMDSIFVALEGDMNFGDAKMTQGTGEVKRGSIYGISGLVGMPVTPEIDLYGRVGWQRSKYTVSDTGFTLEESENGYNIGFGGRYHLTDQIATRLEYRYNKFNINDGIDAKEHQFLAGLQYMF